MSSYFGEYRVALLPFTNPEQFNKSYQRLLSLKRGTTFAVAENGLAPNKFPIWNGSPVDTLFAVDEFLTYADSEEHQISLIKQLCTSTKMRLVITVRDYKNDVYRGEFDKPYYQIDSIGRELVINERTVWSKVDKQAWEHTTYVTHFASDDSEVIKTSTINRRALYFKQLAKFCYDAGCRNFQVLQGESYKPLFKRYFENIIIVEFNQ